MLTCYLNLLLYFFQFAEFGVLTDLLMLAYRKISDVLFGGIAVGVMLTVQQKVKVQLDERWKRDKAHKTETPASMMDKEKAEDVMNSWTRC